jgi:hypothetical protein
MPSDPAAPGATDAQFPDHFSGHAADYARARPTYPDELFAHLASIAPARELAWDVGAGSGQSACALAEHMERVVATDASSKQLAAARPHPRVPSVHRSRMRARTSSRSPRRCTGSTSTRSTPRCVGLRGRERSSRSGPTTS